MLNLDLSFSNYHFDVVADKYENEFLEDTASTYEAILASVGITYHSQVVNFVMECQTYPTAASKLLALELASHFNVVDGGAFPSQDTLANLMGVKPTAVRKYTEDLLSTGYWEIAGKKGRNYIYRLTAESLLVFRKWLQKDRDATEKKRWGKGTPSVMAKSTMTRENNKFHQDKIKREALADQTARGMELLESTPTTYQDVEDSKSALAKHAKNPAGDITVKVTRLGVKKGIADEQVDIVLSIVSHVIVSDELDHDDADKLFNILFAECEKNMNISADALTALTLTLMNQRRKANKSESGVGTNTEEQPTIARVEPPKVMKVENHSKVTITGLE